MSVPSTVKCSELVSRAVAACSTTRSKKSRETSWSHDPLAVLRKGAVVERLVAEVHVEEPAKTACCSRCSHSIRSLRTVNSAIKSEPNRRVSGGTECRPVDAYISSNTGDSSFNASSASAFARRSG